MVTTKTFVGYFLPMVLFIVVLGLIDSTTASKHCKNTVMDVVMTQCSGDINNVRERRDLDEIQRPEFGPDSAVIETSEYRYPVKRQLDASAAIAGIATPIVTEAISTALGHRRYGAAPYPYNMAPVYPQYYVAAAPPPSPSLFQPEPRFGRGFLPQATGADLGFDLSNDEVNELYKEVSQRIMRNSPLSSEEARRVFIEAAAKCCQNKELCLKEKKIISCV